MSHRTPLQSSEPPASPRPLSPLDLQDDKAPAPPSNPIRSKYRRAPKEGGRVAAKDYPKDEKFLILAAAKVYYIKIWTVNPFPDDKLQVKWAIDVWNAVADRSPMPDDQVVQYVSIFIPFTELTTINLDSDSRLLLGTQTRGPS